MKDDVRQKLLRAGVDIEAALERFLNNEELLIKFLEMFLQDESYALFMAAMEDRQYEAAFREAHSLKGLSGNLSLVNLYDIMSREVECLRNGVNIDEAVNLMPEVIKEYEKIKNILETV